ncbi:aerobic respiration control sensor protein arcB [Venturia nashicola]|uniref:Aerobic respiration control sensor protein arcB n=1 Tax=Venturia nashicola TaxID=86259 RepID=A0A4Z1PF45_9PEZI|nr:aerobic respiration control sensor protein arcB [Venturia nashicola]TLD34646.1 aerobic respiration control sensor protein arcB [Venturia nashicola]
MDPMTEDLDALSIKEILDTDSRPTFIIDLDPDDDQLRGDGSIILPVFCNSALRSHDQLFDLVVGVEPLTPQDRSHDNFKAWATGVTKFDDSQDVYPLSFLHAGILWTGSTVRRRWRLISGNALWNPTTHVQDLSKGPPHEVATGGSLLGRLQTTRRKYESPQAPRAVTTARLDEEIIMTSDTETLVSSEQTPLNKSFYRASLDEETGSGVTGLSSNSKGFISLEEVPVQAMPDWTAKHPIGTLSPHMLLAREVNWAATPLGPMGSWSPEFRQLANLCMGNPHPVALFWGAELTMLYNEAYADDTVGNKHPSLMGTGFSGPFSEIWDSIGPVFAECARTGISARKENDYLPIERYGFIEETFFSWTFTPVYGGTNKIVGFYNAPFETTKQVLSQRRMQTINRVGEHVACARTVKHFWKLLLEGLEHNHRDVPFALLYSVGEGDDEDHSSMSSGSIISLKSCHLEGSIGIPDGHPAAPQQLDLKRSREGFIPSFRTSMRTREPTTLHTRDGSLPEELLEGITWRGFGDPCREAIIFPLRPTNGDTVMAFLLLGVNPRRPYDDEYKAFSSMLNRQLATSLASVILFEEEIRRNRDAAEAAALEQAQLTQALKLQTDRLQRMTALSPLGMFNISPEGVIREANDRYFEMTGHPRDNLYEFSFMDHVLESSRKPMMDGWHRMVVDHLPYTGELQLDAPYVERDNLDGEAIEYWVLTTAQPEFASDGSLRSIMGSITDISHLKWAHGLQEKRLKEAEETRRNQNEFIDCVCHEIRNPLSAILQCADDISSTMGEYFSNGILPTLDVVENCIEEANTIALCAQHQKAIVDDILTVSKLDSNLLIITPVSVQPVEIARRAVKMFDAELQSKDLQVLFEAHSSLQELKVEWLMLDPTRVLQVLINLMTNAIKFTASSDSKTITVSVAVSREAPVVFNAQHFEYIPTRNAKANPTTGDDWGMGEVMYLGLKVQDTGCGLNEEEMQQLFKKFSQASPRTHAQYGGSGLGLYICRQLAELHGGQIGVASKAGVGSTFGFYVMVRKTNPPGHTKSRRIIAHTPEFSADLSVSQAVGTPITEDTPTPPILTPPSLTPPLCTPPLWSPMSHILALTPDFNPENLEILVVEDNLVNQKILVQQLRKVGSSVNAVNDGLEALAFLEETFYRTPHGRRLSIILMDLEMPNMDGLTCVRAIREMERAGSILGHVPVIAVTANVREGQITTAMKSGMDGVVGKPFRIPDLLVKIEKLLVALAAASR